MSETPPLKVTRYMPMVWPDYLADTQHLSTVEHGAYMLLIAHYWMNGGPIEYDHKRLIRVCRLESRNAKSVLNSVVRLFKLVDNRLTHSRIDSELESARLKKEKHVQRAENAANTRWRDHATSNATSIPEPMLQAINKQCLSNAPVPSTHSINPEVPSKLTGTAPPPKPKKPAGDYAPVVADCVYLRLSESDKVLAQENYHKKRFPPELLGHSMAVMERWLNTDTPKAIGARRKPNHLRYLYEEWVIEKALKALQIAGTVNGNRELSFAERQRKVLDDEMARILAEEALENEHGPETNSGFALPAAGGLAVVRNRI